jgi:hypothetical protein
VSSTKDAHGTHLRRQRQHKLIVRGGGGGGGNRFPKGNDGDSADTQSPQSLGRS